MKFPDAREHGGSLLKVHIREVNELASHWTVKDLIAVHKHLELESVVIFLGGNRISGGWRWINQVLRKVVAKEKEWFVLLVRNSKVLYNIEDEQNKENENQLENRPTTVSSSDANLVSGPATNLAYSLVLPHLKHRVYNNRLPGELRSTIARVLGPNKPPEPVIEPSESTEAAKKTCKICPSRLKRRTQYNCIECRKPICLGCLKTICVDCVDNK
ncbi:hypothetical protein EVAR_83308_1 [Eumeta japonica]|uniref:Uncharacterized protein n=1 Tax=Eumeta variegata TaxID=151549 RepID=A0A4C1VVJ0_EUMVA|nr:hypothetical protein EVAR_83308_1 [Eumeta japonica]